MYVHLGGGVTVPSREVAAVFDLDNATTSIPTNRKNTPQNTRHPPRKGKEE